MCILIRFGFIATLALWGFATPAAAQTFEACSPHQAEVAGSALRQAKDLTLKAASLVGDTPEYERWFGRYSPSNAETVRGNLKRLVGAIRDGGIRVRCETTGANGCGPGEYARVFPDQHYVLRVCPGFFGLPALTALEPGTPESDDGTREGTIVHELSHFTRVGATEDHCYSRTACSRMAGHDPVRAIENADSYQYFTEDVTYYSRQPVAGKPSTR